MTKTEPVRVDSRWLIARLSTLMFLQYAALGLWAVTVGTYIAENTGDAGAGIFSEGFIGLSATAGAIGALVSPVLLGIVADRYFATERLLSVLHALCAASLWGMCACDRQWVFYAALLTYFHAYTPTTSLSSSLTLRQLPNPDKHFTVVRANGTLGWVVAGLLVGYIWPELTGDSIEATVRPIQLAAGCHLLLSLYSLSLPRTPASGRTAVGWRTLAGGASLWGNGPFLIFLAISALAGAPSQFYNSFVNPFLNYIEFGRPAAKLALGQIVEVGCLVALPLIMRRARFKTLFLVGMIGWTLRFVMFSVCQEGSALLAYPAILMHGACFTFVFMTGQLYADRMADRDARGAAQGLHTLVVYGVGQLIGAVLGGAAQALYLTPEGASPPPYDWPRFWLVPAALSLTTTVLFALFFHEDRDGGSDSSKDQQATAA